MAKIKLLGDCDYYFFCPGCGYRHPFRVGGDLSLPQWTWNGSVDSPTFSPSLLCNQPYPDKRCHLFVRDGMIQYLSDCHHSLAGQTIPMVDMVEKEF